LLLSLSEACGEGSVETWTVIAVERVPRPILGGPVEYYRNRPDHWKQHGPPPWAEAKGRDKDRGYEGEKGRGGGKGHGKD
jgi:hypothetical protein